MAYRGGNGIMDAFFATKAMIDEKRNAEAFSDALSSALTAREESMQANAPGAPELMPGVQSQLAANPFESEENMLSFLKQRGSLDAALKSGRLGDILALTRGKAREDGEQWETLSGGALKKYGLSADTGTWQRNKKTGYFQNLVRPTAEEGAEAPTMRAVDSGDETVTYQWNAGSKKWDEIARAPRWQPSKPGEEFGMSQPVTITSKGRDPITGADTESSEVLEFVSRRGGGGFITQKLAESEKSTPLSKPEAGAVAGAREGVRIVGELRELLLPSKGPNKGKLNTGALASKAIGLPGVVAPEGASIMPKVLQAIDPYVRLTTGAALNEQELANAETMFVPSIKDNKELVQDKLSRLERFLSGDLALMGMVSAPGSAVSQWVASQGGDEKKKAASVPKISGKAEYDKLKSGDPFEWNGKRGIKP